MKKPKVQYDWQSMKKAICRQKELIESELSQGIGEVCALGAHAEDFGLHPGIKDLNFDNGERIVYYGRDSKVRKKMKALGATGFWKYDEEIDHDDHNRKTSWVKVASGEGSKIMSLNDHGSHQCEREHGDDETCDCEESVVRRNSVLAYIKKKMAQLNK